VGSHGRKTNGKYVRCVRSFSQIRLSKTSPTHSRSNHTAAIVLLTLAAAISLHAQSYLKSVPTKDQKIVRRWALEGDPHGIALGADGTVYVGLAQPQAVVAIDSTNGEIKQKVILDSAEIAATKELVTLRMNAERNRL